MLNCLVFQKVQLTFNFWGFVLEAFLRPLTPPMHAGFYILSSAFFYRPTAFIHACREFSQLRHQLICISKKN
jgi:hypothetical protein